jgi:chromosome segregation ATPase
MYQDEQDLNNIKLEIGLLKKDHEQMQAITDKLSVTIEKIQEMNANLLRMIALHDQKHDQHQRTEDSLKDDIKELHSRITTITRELHDKIDEIEKTLGIKLDSIKDAIKKDDAESAIGGKEKGILGEFTKYKWMIIGAFISIFWLLKNVNLAALGSLMK